MTTIYRVPLNKSLYTTSYMLLTSATAGLLYYAIYLLVDVYGYKQPTFLFEWMGKHSLSIFILVASNMAIIAAQGFYWAKPENNNTSLHPKHAFLGLSKRLSSQQIL
ncbi:hypothetical protein AMTR_s00100p00089680 [Amborella trichopoda]|uniref:Uncharacterized protein n=1 Tax=Amborella trichopoda TaxID=13333 RepID=W1NYG9_AMBTC|nr:hypothetical protein AMTR_s00100p00089680 [Amborella trichopoda]